MTKKALTIKDIARLSGYAVGTVSRTLNNSPGVSNQARKKILSIVTETGFMLNTNAQKLKQHSSLEIAIIVKGTANQLFFEILENILNIIANSQYNSTVIFIDEDDNEVMHAIAKCHSDIPCSIIFLGADLGNFKKDFSKIEIPSIIMTNSAADLSFSNLSSIATNDFDASKYAMEYILSNGHTKIGILGGNINQINISRNRYLGCMAALNEKSIKFNKDKAFIESRFSYESSYENTKKLIIQYPEITAVFAMSDVSAIGALCAARDMGKNIPNELSMVGFDGLPISRYYNPALVTISQNKKEIAELGLKILFDQIENNASAKHEYVPYKFQNGNSVTKIKK